MRWPIRIACAALLIAAPAAAQQGWRVIEVPRTAAERARGVAPAEMSRSALLLDLAGTLGAVHYFVVACDGRGNQYWRERMIAVLDAEAGGDRYLRSAMIQAFNDGYRGHEADWPECTEAARDARARAAARGLTISEALGSRYR